MGDMAWLDTGALPRIRGEEYDVPDRKRKDAGARPSR